MLTVEIWRVIDGQLMQVLATLVSGVWTCDNAEFLAVLNQITLPPGYYPDRDRMLAELVISMYGNGKIIDSRIRHAAPADAIY